ncbi:N-acetyl-gamma-glutamyl-phosphate reductase [Paenalkalicoccus suaedae]|uniref:N-acetyl-gamma-glutamyl-phosphate reductase n=1 Tax=Paenalkalicoccus suaedae TaxID=2592382 RepID=A0A859FCZ5_9BACI|nr:N-acetyl-gamma-glutamyl-phosphate reductase [Paenalkalicoccus suaedae]QKS71223.1 N-acetyl-gamma-glutamyl-phosphate reductase [Paenalkalicoccus suaedae]
MLKVAIVGGTGYGALELIRLMQHHEQITIHSIVSTSEEGELVSTRYPHLKGVVTNTFDALDINKIAKEVDTIFYATPAGVAKSQIEACTEDVQHIDLSGDFRLSKEDYEAWYGLSAPDKDALSQAVYGLSEVNKDAVAKAKILSNPGCFPTATLLALLPGIKESLIDTQDLVIDGKTGVSGAGRKQSLLTHYSETNENVTAYKLGKHQHIPEIERYLSEQAGEDVAITFTTHLIPMTRGIMMTCYGKLKDGVTEEGFIQAYKEFYKEEKFVRVRETGVPSTSEVYGSNYCDIGFHIHERTRRVIIVSVIDNLVKGASGQALQNFNIMNGLDEQMGLTVSPVYP